MVDKKRSGRYLKFLIYLVAVILVNVAGITLFFRMDLTENSIYSISGASQKVVGTLSEPLTIKVFFTRNLPAPYNNTERYLQDLMQEYAIYANKFFNYRFYNEPRKIKNWPTITVSIRSKFKQWKRMRSNFKEPIWVW